MIRVHDFLTCGCSHRMKVENLVYQTKNLKDIRIFEKELNLRGIKGKIQYNIFKDMDNLSNKLDIISAKLNDYSMRYQFLVSTTRNIEKTKQSIFLLNRHFKFLEDRNFASRFKTLEKQIKGLENTQEESRNKIKKIIDGDNGFKSLSFLYSMNIKKINYIESSNFIADGSRSFCEIYTTKEFTDHKILLCLSSTDENNQSDFHFIDQSFSDTIKLKININEQLSKVFKYNYKIQVLVIEG